MAHPGGVLSRAGHTEAGCDLARLAGYQPASVIVEILNEDGSMARLPQLMKVAEKYDLKIISIEVSNTIIFIVRDFLFTEFNFRDVIQLVGFLILLEFNR